MTDRPTAIATNRAAITAKNVPQCWNNLQKIEKVPSCTSASASEQVSKACLLTNAQDHLQLLSQPSPNVNNDIATELKKFGGTR